MAGYGLVMVLAQVRLIPMFTKLHFMPSFWSFTFSWTAVTFASMFWLHGGNVAGWRIWISILLSIITLFVGAIAARTVIALRRGTLLPARLSESNDCIRIAGDL
jgi:tellurite resistance protein